MLPEILDKARGFYKAGQLPRAERACRQVLDQDNSSAPAWFLLGLVAYQAGRDDDAITAFREAIARKPDYHEAHNNLGISLARLGKLPEAEASFRATLEHRPDYPEAHNNLGNALRDQGRLDEAIGHYRAAIRLSPRYTDVHNNLGIVHARNGQWAEAEACYREALRHRPNHPEAHNNLGTALASQKRFEEAIAAFEESLRLKPAYADAHGNLGLTYSEQGRWSEAVAVFREAVKLAPRSHGAHLNLGRALAQQGDLQGAAAAFRQAIGLDDAKSEAYRQLGDVLERAGDLAGAEEAFERVAKLRPKSAATHNRLGSLLAARRRFSKAIWHFERAIELKPDLAEARRNRALVRLITGDFERGWPDYAGHSPAAEEQVPKAPRWAGEPLGGRRILLVGDSGTADTLQFIRYARLLKRDGATVVVQAPPALAALLRHCPDLDEVATQGNEAPEHDYWSPLASLPAAFQTTLATIPSDETPYLATDERRIARWRDELAYIGAFKIGVLWRGEEAGPNDRRAIPLTHFSPLAALAGVHLLSLEQGGSREQLALAPLAVTDLGGRLDHSAETLVDLAAAIQSLDLVITADGALAHLAGGLGAPVWVALPYAGDWRWLVNRDDSPWYPTMRLFRQPEADDWAPVFERMASTLGGMLAARGEKKPALGLAPPTPARLNTEGVKLAHAGRLDEALVNFRQAIALKPEFAEAHNNLGNALQNQGRLEEAAERLREALRLREAYPEAHNNLGLTLHKQRDFDDAERSFARALELRPDFAQAANNRGLALADLRKSAEAEAMFRRAIEIDPNYASAHANLGRALVDLGKMDEALAAMETAVRLAPNNADTHNSLGNLQRELKKFDESLKSFQKAIELRPQYADAHNNLGTTHARQNNFEQAIKHYREALRLRPNFVIAHNNLAIALAQADRRTEAMANYRQAIQLKPDYAEAYNNLAIVLTQEACFEEALTCYRRAIELKENYPEAHSNLGIALTEFGRTEEAIGHFSRAIEMREDYPDAYMNRALTHLLRGDFEQGWTDYEWRWKCKDFNARNFKQPRWQGEPLEGRRILLHSEQGFGDTFQFVRYARLVKERGGVVLVRAPKPVLRILQLCPYIDGLVADGGESPAFDTHLPLLSLPYIFETTLETVPADEPYLFADPELVARWRRELGYIDAVKVGVNWQGNPKYRGDRRRSIPLAHFAPLAQIEGVRLVSLQRNFGAEQIKDARFSITELGGQVDEASGPFMDTAAILKNLDLIITSDTSLVHLAGGLGAPVWLAIPKAPDWRWLLERPDSPWYPSMRLFRQPEFDNWEPVFERIAEELEKLVASKRRRPPFQAWLEAGELLDRLAALRAERRLAEEDGGPFEFEEQFERIERQAAHLASEPEVEDWLVELDGIHEELKRARNAALVGAAESNYPAADAIADAFQAEMRRDAIIREANRRFRGRP